VHRITLDPRPNWQQRVEEYGLHYHTLRGETYWDESACYEFTPAQIDAIDYATEDLHKMCLALVGEVIEKRMFEPFQIPKEFEQFVVRSWEAREPSVYGRFDLAYDGVNPPKMLEYNADTPTALLEAAVAQWTWLKDVDPAGDQFNSLHDRLIAVWKKIHAADAGPIHFAAMRGVEEDYINVEYLRDTAIQAGFKTAYLDVEDIGWDAPRRTFVDNTGFPIQRIFKLYPWEFMVREDYAPQILEATARWIEPAWKMILSCKAILPLLYQRHPDSPYLLPAAFEPLPGGNYVRKPVHAREGANIQVTVDGQLAVDTGGPYGGPFVYQAIGPVKPHDGRFPVIGSWIIDDWPAGIGVREDDSLVTRNTSRFIPHRMAGG
jgi:glutathionylspermidine synthase